MKNLIIKLNPWLMMIGMYLSAFIGIIIPAFAEWPLVPIIFLALIPTFIKSKGNPRWDIFASIVVGAFLIQILWWIHPPYLYLN